MSSRAAPTPPSTRREAALRFLVGRIDYERTQSMPCSEEAMKLDRMRELLGRLGNPQEGMPIVHVAGTKGKGSTSAMVAAVLSAAGYRTGLFTSPHLDGSKSESPSTASLARPKNWPIWSNGFGRRSRRWTKRKAVRVRGRGQRSAGRMRTPAIRSP